MLSAIRRASSLVSDLAANLRPGSFSPWSVEEQDACDVVRDHGRQALPRREAAILQSGCRFLSQAHQHQPHGVIKVGGGEVGAAELQLGDEAPEEYAALLYRQAGGGRPDRSKLRIRQSQHAAIVLPSDVNILTDQGGGGSGEPSLAHSR